MGNILDKTDMSQAPVPSINGNSVVVPKRLKNNWSQKSKPGIFMMLKKESLNIDGKYQRDVVSDLKIREIARNWDWALFGVVLVAVRSDATYWVFDGGHRTRASFYRDDIDSLPCMVYMMECLSEEAKAFLGKNLMITNVSPIDKYKAAVVADDEIANKASKLLSELGIKAAKAASSTSQLKCITTVMQIIERDESLARRCLTFCIDRSEGESIKSPVLRGLFGLCFHMKEKVDVLDVYGDRLHCHSQKEMEIKIRQKRAECGIGGEKIEAIALMEMINKGLKTRKLTW